MEETSSGTIHVVSGSSYPRQPLCSCQMAWGCREGLSQVSWDVGNPQHEWAVQWDSSPPSALAACDLCPLRPPTPTPCRPHA